MSANPATNGGLIRNGQPVDATGQMATGEKFADVRDFKLLLVKNERQIARNMVHQFVAYATGAPVSGRWVLGSPLITKENAEQYYFPESPY